MKTLMQLVVPFLVKADDIDKEARTFSGLAAVWDLDLGDDIIHKGAFKTTIKEWKTSGEALPLLNSHNHFDIMSTLGQALELKETDDGLLSKWELIDGADGDAALARLRPSKRTGRAVIGKMSIGYEPVKFDFEESDAARFGQIRHLREVRLKEVSLVIFPMAPGASIDAGSVKFFMDSLAHTDPQTVSVDTKQELRRLTSRIGNILSKAKQSEDPPIGDPPPEPVPSPAPTPPAPVPPTPVAPPVGDPAPEKQDLDGGPPDPLAPDPKAATPVYQYPDALKQRLQKALLDARVAAINNSNTESP